MDGHRPAGALSDETLDRELAAAMLVTPSPEFLARVRVRLANEPAPAGSAWIRWGLLTVPAAIAVVTVTLMVLLRAPQPAPPQAAVRTMPTVPSAASTSAAVMGSAPAPPVSSRDDRPAPATAHRDQPSRSKEGTPRPRYGAASAATAVVSLPPANDAPPFAEVLISQDEVQAFERFVAAAQQRRMPPMPVQAAPANVAEQMEWPRLEIDPLVIEPLQQAAVIEQGERQ